MDNFANALNIEHGQKLAASQFAQNATTAAPDTGLMRLANTVSEAGARVEQIASNMSMLAHGIHGPRPEPVSSATDSHGQSADSLSARVSSLMQAIDRLQRAYESVVR